MTTALRVPSVHSFSVASQSFDTINRDYGFTINSDPFMTPSKNYGLSPDLLESATIQDPLLQSCGMSLCHEPATAQFVMVEETDASQAPAPPVAIGAMETGTHSRQGWKPQHPDWENQDCYMEMFNLRGGHSLFGVFDGHGPSGANASYRVKTLFAGMADTLASAVDIEAAFQDAFAQVAAEFEAEGSAEDSGTTVTLALVDSWNSTVSIANVGDSTALLVHPTDGVIYTSTDHKPTEENEAQRLRMHGSQIINGRLLLTGNPNYHFGLSRAIGDLAYVPQGVSSEPEVACNLPFEPGCVLIIASDGLWDMVSKDAATNLAQMLDAQDAAERLVTDARSGWLKFPHVDDITAVIVKPLPAETATPVFESFINMSRGMSMDSSMLETLKNMSPYSRRKNSGSTRVPESPECSSGENSPIQCSPFRDALGDVSKGFKFWGA